MKDEGKPATLTSALRPSSFIPHPSLWRTFCAIEIPANACSRLTDHINELRRQFPNVRASWARSDKFHLTLKFLGETPKERVESLSNAAARATVSLTPFKLIIESAGAFPPSGPPKVLWLGITDVAGGLTDLQARLEGECEQEGFAKEPRPFHPHLTVARLREPRGARALASLHKQIGFPGFEFSVLELLVIRSELGSAGSKYTTISRHAFTGTAGVPPA
jgi:RNA 2',3'-cyclic 3'-phosphodiesterase